VTFLNFMCGIFGIVARQAHIPDGLVERATASLAHRGPDDSGTVFLRAEGPKDLEIGLGNRRLAILDLSPLGHQPMHNPATGDWIIYNGEIYNFREIRGELEKSGAHFISHSDTEVVLRAYEHWGEECLPRFQGMFAFAIWDARRQRLLLARDPMGIKPLYYFDSGQYFLFASEVRTLLRTGLVPRKIDPAGLENFLTFGSAYDPLTMIGDVRALAAGHTLTWQNGAVRESKYWDLIDHSGSDDLPRRVLAEGKDDQFTAVLHEAVQGQLISDVPVGVFLSGGIDSSALVSILSTAGVRPSTFSIVFRESDYSEAPYSRLVAKYFGTDHHEIEVSQENALSAIPDALSAMDLPTMDGLNTFFVSQAARGAGVKVALSGLGGDEVFGGYSSFRTVPQMERFVRAWRYVPWLLRSPLAWSFGVLSSDTDQGRKLRLLATANGHAPHPYFLSRMLFTSPQRDLLFPGRKQVEEQASASQRRVLERALALDPVNRVSYLESRCYMLNTLLRDADFMSMSQGLELRVPLIDHQLAQAVLRLPGDYKVNRTPKKLLVGALRKNLPDAIVYRSKRGFTLPFESWMRRDLRDEIEPVFTGEKISSGPLGGLLRGEWARQIWLDFLGGKVSWSRPWSLYVLQRWCELNL
jgi:asparagine synthase (glutamine-hydrolysing)